VKLLTDSIRFFQVRKELAVQVFRRGNLEVMNVISLGDRFHLREERTGTYASQDQVADKVPLSGRDLGERDPHLEGDA
jgi:hypothetical protein